MTFALRVLAAAGPKGVTNLLTANQASGTDTLSNTTGFLFSQVTGASSTTIAIQGSRSLQLTSTSTSNGYAYCGSSGTGAIPISASTAYTMYGQVRKDASATALYGVVQLWWYDSSGTACSPTYVSEVDSGALSSGSWLELVGNATSPSDAAYCRPAVSIQTSNTASSIYYVDQLGLWLGTSTEWAMP